MAEVLPVAERENPDVAYATGLPAGQHFKVTSQINLWFKLPSLSTGLLPKDGDRDRRKEMVLALAFVQ